MRERLIPLTQHTHITGVEWEALFLSYGGKERHRPSVRLRDRCREKSILEVTMVPATPTKPLHTGTCEPAEHLAADRWDATACVEPEALISALRGERDYDAALHVAGKHLSPDSAKGRLRIECVERNMLRVYLSCYGMRFDRRMPLVLTAFFADNLAPCRNTAEALARWEDIEMAKYGLPPKNGSCRENLQHRRALEDLAATIKQH